THLAKSVNWEQLEKAAEWTCAAKDDLPIVDVSWDKTALQNSVFDWAGWPDNPDPEKAKGAFLAFDAANAELKGSYKLPFARYENGKLEAVEGALRAAASRLPQ